MTSTSPRPTGTLAVAVRNEGAHIKRGLDSILVQDYPPDALEVLVYGGDSTDASRSIVTAIAGSDRRVTLLRNPRRLQAAAWNLGSERARGGIVGIGRPGAVRSARSGGEPEDG